jgi:hypothetical protein
MALSKKMLIIGGVVLLLAVVVSVVVVSSSSSSQSSVLIPTVKSGTMAPTTMAPTTMAPTTMAPTTMAPTTMAPMAPTTMAPTTMAPTTMAPTTMAPTTMAPTTSPLVLLQNRINDIISGKTPLNNLNVVNSLTVVNNNPNDSGTLKLNINVMNPSSTKNVVSFLRSGKEYNNFGVQDIASAPAGKTIVWSNPVSVASAVVPTISSLQTQINNIINGTQPLYNLKVNGPVTVNSTQGYAVYLKNQSSNTNKYGNTIVFIKATKIIGVYGVSGLTDNKYDHVSSDSCKWGNTNWDARVGGTNAPCTTTTLPPVSTFNASNVSELNAQLDNIINGMVPLNNLSVQGDMTISGDSNSLLRINNTNCDPTNLVNFSDLAGRGTNGYGGPFDWIDWGTVRNTLTDI